MSAVAAFAMPILGLTQTEEMLWPKGAPDAVDALPASKPSLTLFPATGAKLNGAAVVICPGGGYRGLASDHEGKQVPCS